MQNNNSQASQAESGTNNSEAYFAELSAEAQRARLLDRLRIGPVSTIEARRSLEILAPAARVMELRGMGHCIDTVWTHEQTDAGVSHRVGLYVLKVA